MARVSMPNALLMRVYQSPKSAERVYLRVIELGQGAASGGEWDFTVPVTVASPDALRGVVGQVVSVEAEVKGTLFSGDKGSVQRLNVTNIAVKPVSGSAASSPR